MRFVLKKRPKRVHQNTHDVYSGNQKAPKNGRENKKNTLSLKPTPTNQ